MKIDILTLFPDMFVPLKTSILGNAISARIIEINIHDIRNYTLDKHKKCDDTPFGGGAGMVMTAQPIGSAIESIDPNHLSKRIYLSPKGKLFSQAKVEEYSKLSNILLLCGHYEGIDQRVIDLFVDEELSIGNYVLTGGEIPAMAVTDAVCRYVDGVINSESLREESFADDGLLEYPQYTKPQEYKGLKVPEILLSGNHEEIKKWRKKMAFEITEKHRPDLLKG